MVYWTLGGFFMMGLLGGTSHCLGMCHPFILYIATKFAAPGPKKISRYQQIVPQLWYNLGRMLTYTSLGVLAGLLGKLSSELLMVQQLAAWLAGGLLILYGAIGLLSVQTLSRLENVAVIQMILGAVKSCQPGHPLPVGVALGFLPCGLIYSALVAAAALAHPLWSGAAMLLFAIGTSVAMLFGGLLGSQLAHYRQRLQVPMMLFLIFMGGYFWWQI